MSGQSTVAVAKALADALLAGEDVLCVLLSGNTTSWQTDATAEGFDFLDDITDDEPAWTGYSRQTLTSVTVTENASSGRAEVDAADVAFGSTIDSSAATVDGVAFAIDGASDAERKLIGIYNVTGESTANRTPDGESEFSVQIGASGFWHVIVRKAS